MSSTKLPKIFLDSGNPQDSKKAKGILGFLDGQTTNPTLVAKHPEAARFLEKGKKLTEKDLLDFYRQIIKDIEKEIAGPISVEVYADWDTDYKQMLQQAENMNSWGKNIFIKFPTIPEGLKAAEAFVKQGGKVNMTLVFDQTQAAAVYTAILSTGSAAKGNKAFISPFLGRWDDRGFLGLDLLKNIIKMYKKFNKTAHLPKPQVAVLAASIRNLDHLYGSIFLGADIVTIPLKIIEEWVEAEKYIPNNSYRIKSNNLKAIIYEDLPLKKNYNEYDIKKTPGDLLFEGLKRFIADWKSLIAEKEKINPAVRGQKPVDKNLFIIHNK